ncbi:MAG: hypothetical protein ACOYNU_08685 [Bacteroidales bacterium]
MGTRAEIYIDAFSDIIITSFESRIKKNQLSFQAAKNISAPSHSLIVHGHHFFSALCEERGAAKHIISSIGVRKITAGG